MVELFEYSWYCMNEVGTVETETLAAPLNRMAKDGWRVVTSFKDSPHVILVLFERKMKPNPAKASAVAM